MTNDIAGSQNQEGLKLFVGNFVDTPSAGELRIRREHLLAVSPEGYITHLAPLHSDSSQLLLSTHPDAAGSSLTQIPAHSFLLPTFTDLHLHAPQYMYYGTGLDLPLLQWLEQYAYKAEERIDASAELAERVYGRLVQRLKENGTGCVSLFGTIGVRANLILAKKMQEAGLRGFIGKLSMDESPRPTYGESSASASLASVTDFIDSLQSYLSSFKPHERLVEPIITPRFIPVCSDELLVGLQKLGQEKGVRVQSHMCEGRDQMDMVMKSRGKRDQDLWDELGFLGPKTLQAHVTYLDENMIPLVKERQLTMAHCPLSNAYLSEKQFPLREAIDADLQVGLGTDIAGGYSPSIQVQMRQAVIISRLREGARCESLDCSFADADAQEADAASSKNVKVDWKEAVYLATRGGKKGMGLGGALEVGMEFDVQLIELASRSSPSGTGPLDLFDLKVEEDPSKLDEAWWNESIERWWCNGDERNRKGMWVQGKKIA
ncbi:guanine deaminase [Kwoniella heveanensis BCC8398]|uniref:Guanine deaminase n=1 Tax=Kwoniella heveanensis BCC8398 TaxID=1296120 RepID=A0A1B9GVF1_9TREE|nr:guanine deaminase [Kwoniella heveanensis BCC8398]